MKEIIEKAEISLIDKCKHKVVKLGYLDAHDDARSRISKGEKQIMCEVCKLWIWESHYE